MMKYTTNKTIVDGEDFKMVLTYIIDSEYIAGSYSSEKHMSYILGWVGYYSNFKDRIKDYDSLERLIEVYISEWLIENRRLIGLIQRDYSRYFVIN